MTTQNNHRCKVCGNPAPYVNEGDTYCKQHQQEPTMMLKVLAIRKSLIDRLKQEAAADNMTLKEKIQFVFEQWLKQRDTK
jgi:uncharacterized Zn finger protein (UPF0148 family)